MIFNLHAANKSLQELAFAYHHKSVYLVNHRTQSFLQFHPLEAYSKQYILHIKI